MRELVELDAEVHQTEKDQSLLLGPSHHQEEISQIQLQQPL